MCVCSAVMQLYPESAEQLELITTIALRCGFSGGLVVDYPNSRKARKHYLCLFAGLDAAKPLPAALGAADSAAAGAGAPSAGTAVSFAGRTSTTERVRGPCRVINTAFPLTMRVRCLSPHSPLPSSRSLTRSLFCPEA
jgi:18S rRNA (guanine1575-N7)-methyltransferase